MGSNHSREVDALRDEVRNAERKSENQEAEISRLHEKWEREARRAHAKEARRMQAEHDRREREFRKELEAIRVAQRKTEEAIAQRQRELHEYPITEWLLPFVNHEGPRTHLNVALLGGSGSGKSSLINRLRGFPNRRSAPPGQWAETGVTETTVLPRSFTLEVPHSTLTVNLWDLPGVGTPRFPSEGYFRTVGLRHFDHVILVCAGRFTENDLNLRDELEQVHVPFSFVRSKLDIDVQNNFEVEDIQEDVTVARIREDIRGQGVMNPFLVSVRRGNTYDLEVLIQRIHQAVQEFIAAFAETE